MARTVIKALYKYLYFLAEPHEKQPVSLAADGHSILQLLHYIVQKVPVHILVNVAVKTVEITHENDNSYPPAKGMTNAKFFSFPCTFSTQFSPYKSVNSSSEIT